MKAFLVVVVALLTVFRSPRPIDSVDVVHIKSASAVLAPEARTSSSNDSASAATSKTSKSTDDAAGGNGTTPCDRHLRSTEVEVRNPRNHKFVTSNGWTERQRPRPEINVYSRIEELPSPQPPPVPAAATSYYQQQRDNFYHNSRQQQLQQLQPAVRTSKRIIYYATLPDVVRPPAGYPSPPPYSADSFGIGGPGSFSADFRQIDSNRNGPTSADHLQRNRLAPYENAYNRGGSGVTSVTSKSTAVYNSRYDEPAEFRDPFFRNNEFSSKFASWAEPFYKSWTSSSPPPWERDPITRFSNWSPFSWDREGPLGGGGGGGGGGPLDNRVSSSWENRGSSWDKELVEVPLQKPTVGSRGDVDDDDGDNKFGPEVAVVKSGVIDVRSSPPPPVSRFTIVDVDPKPQYPRRPEPYPQRPEPYPQRPEHLLPPSMRFDERRDPIVHQPHPNTRFDERRDPMIHQQPPPNVRYDPMSQQQKPMRYETYTPMQPPTRYEHDQPPYMQQRFEQQYRAPPSSSSSSSSQYGQHNQNKQPSKNYYETSKNNVNTHQFMTSWTEVSNHDDVSPTHSVNLDISSIGNSTSVHNNTRIIPYTNTTKTPK